MKAIFNFKVVISDNQVKSTFDTEKVEEMSIAQQQALLKVFSDVEKKIVKALGICPNNKPDAEVADGDKTDSPE